MTFFRTESGDGLSVPPVVTQIAGFLARTLAVAGAAYLAGHSDIKLSEDHISAIVTFLIPVLAGVVLWGLRSIVRGRQKLFTALGSTRAMTEGEVEAMVENPRIKNPSILTQKHEIP